MIQEDTISGVHVVTENYESRMLLGEYGVTTNGNGIFDVKILGTVGTTHFVLTSIGEFEREGGVLTLCPHKASIFESVDADAQGVRAYPEIVGDVIEWYVEGLAGQPLHAEMLGKVTVRS